MSCCEQNNKKKKDSYKLLFLMFKKFEHKLKNGLIEIANARQSN